jgi:hypothetical protein
VEDSNKSNCIHEEIQSRLYSHLLSKNVKIKIYKAIILLFFLYGCETWSLTLRKEHILTIFENRLPRRMLGPKRVEVVGGWRRLHYAELHDLYASPNVISG